MTRKERLNHIINRIEDGTVYVELEKNYRCIDQDFKWLLDEVHKLDQSIHSTVRRLNDMTELYLIKDDELKRKDYELITVQARVRYLEQQLKNQNEVQQ